jgi:acetyltransferase
MSTAKPSSKLHEVESLESPERHDLTSILSPRAVAVIGASDRAGSVGQTVMQNLLAGGFQGKILPINPKHEAVMGLRAWPTIAAANEPIDVAVIATPAEAVPQVIAQCAEVGVGGVVVISAGFRECGEAGAALERQIREKIRRSGMRLIGPNCLGVAVPQIGLNATFARAAATPGHIAFLSQSGALCAAILDWSVRERVGFSAVVSTGSMLDVGWGDLIDYFGDDPTTKAIAIYMESIGGEDPHSHEVRSFLSAAREVALVKPIVVVKSGKSAASGRAAASHTGRMAGSDAAVEAAFRRAGVLRVETIQDLFDMVQVLDRQPRPRGPGLAIVTNAGGPGVLATDALSGAGAKLATLQPATIATLAATLPPHWSHGNPIDVLGDAGADRYAAAVAAAVAVEIR